MRVGSIGNPARDQIPGLAEICGLENIRLQIVELVRVHRGVSRAGIMRGRFHQTHHAPFRNAFRSDVGPVLAAIAGNVYQAVIGSSPDQVFLHRRFRNRENRVVVLNRGVVFSKRTA